MQIKQSISLFFLFSLLNIALVPQLCLSAWQEDSKGVPFQGSTQEENELAGFQFSEEESKEGNEENKTGADSFVKLLRGTAIGNLYSLAQFIKVNSMQKLYLNDYSSITKIPLSPPPDFA